MSGKNVSRRRRLMLGAGIASPWLARAAQAQSAAAAAPPPLLDFMKWPTIRNVQLAPDGQAICGLREINGRLNAVVVDLKTRKALIVTNFKDRDVGGLKWINEKRLQFWLFDRTRGGANQTGSGIYVINRDASDFRALSGVDDPNLLPIHSSIVRTVYENGRYTDDVIVYVGSFQKLGTFSSNLYRVDSNTGRRRLLTMGGPNDTVRWVVDRNHVPRAALSVTDDVTKVHYRDNADAPWREIFRYRVDDVASSVEPLDFDADGNLYVNANAGRDCAAIYRYDPKAGRLDPEPVAALENFDLDDGLIFSRGGKRLLGVSYYAERPGVHWIDPKYAAIQQQVDQALKSTYNRLYFDLTDAESPVVLVSSWSDRDPGRYYLYDPKAVRLEQIAATRPWIDPEKMRPTKFFRYAARDGLSIPAQLTTPAGSGPFPLVVLHYGGPWVRPIRWHWDESVQFLVSRGYAVFMPAPRASTGFGAKLYKAGWKQWGLGMQDDVADGVRALIKQGIVDEKRVCIAGASYGGYMTMMGLVKEPELYKCGINWVGVTDPAFMFNVAYTDFNEVDAARYTLPLLIGDPDKDAEQFKRTSPVLRAAEIKQPVLMAYGAQDRRVPLVNGEKMLAALKPHNKNVEWVVYPDEGHGWFKVETDVDFWTRVEKFLATHLK